MSHATLSDVSDGELEEGELTVVDEIDENGEYRKHVEIDNDNYGTHDYCSDDKNDFLLNFDRNDNVAHVPTYSDKAFHRKRRLNVDQHYLKKTKKPKPTNTPLRLKNGKTLKTKVQYGGIHRPYSEYRKHRKSPAQTHPYKGTKNDANMDWEREIMHESTENNSDTSYYEGNNINQTNERMIKHSMETQANNVGSFPTYNRPEMHENNTSPNREEIPLSIEKIEHSSEEFKCILGEKIMKIVMQSDREAVKIRRIFQRFAEQNKPSLENIECLRKFIKSRYAQSAVKVHSKTVETPQLDLKICPIYTKEVRNNHECSDLHLCKFYLIDGCSNERCKFGHNFKTKHNQKVLALHRVENLHGNEIRLICKDVRSRNSTTLPIVCRFYNRGQCNKNTSCPFLHICNFFIEDDCKFTPRCKRSHYFYDNQPSEVLRRHGLEGFSNDQLKKLIQRTFREKYLHPTTQNQDKSTASIRDPLDQEYIETKRDIHTVDFLPLEVNVSASGTFPALIKNEIAINNANGKDDSDINALSITVSGVDHSTNTDVLLRKHFSTDEGVSDIHPLKLNAIHKEIKDEKENKQNLPLIQIKQEPYEKENEHARSMQPISPNGCDEGEESKNQVISCMNPEEIKKEIDNACHHIDNELSVQEGNAAAREIIAEAGNPNNTVKYCNDVSIYENNTNGQSGYFNLEIAENKNNIDRPNIPSIRVDLGGGKHEFKLENGQWKCRSPGVTFRTVSQRIAHQLDMQLSCMRTIMLDIDKDHTLHQ
ncbi:uncharacterized protein LOC128220605 isoform X2 [Mya arenaria]|nr:uncharacterized protein LOC128220605 isoform X2 [Mya arenaria]XP_052785026.1 uncharacterized protein LOC128220605 isoform X2 [Mya arenaria]XP_052785027.1 uncharacterized protein LOC128220605 isoform X2 [Mya arenaria]XP_052785029.1 uncharacterized protein LOC128220605 isoform X2 [Mya arenaria]XP_052785030.1 uncharacterized protein LOC128220605 isoform X2 [Mya arenaria]XP_052785031.1 uncharacterized protein LOC128220605 isoform X2 [Mya arenaria]XP_052785032.1 uncharacterized protein LOC12822